MDLEAIPGVGAKTADRLAELEDPEAALEAGDVAAIARAPGISEARAARIARAAVLQRHADADADADADAGGTSDSAGDGAGDAAGDGAGDGDFLATDRAREIYDAVLDRLQERAVTDYATQRLRVLYPTGATSRIEEVRAFAREAMDRDPGPAVLEALDEVEPLDSPGDVRVRDRCLATADAETYSRAREAIPELSVELVDGPRDLTELARGYSTVVALDDAFAGVDVDGDVRVEPDALSSPTSVVPERSLAFFARNRDCIRAAAAVHRRADIDPPSPLEGLEDLDDLESALSRIDDDGTVAGDEELDRLSAAVDDLDAAVSAAEGAANDRLRRAIEERDVTIEGADLLSLVERGAGVDSLLQRELADEYADAVAAARDHLVDALDLTDTADVARRAFPDDPTYPVEHDDRAVARLRDELTRARDRRATRRKRELAADLAALTDPVEELVRAALELDVELAIARFARDFECTMPEFVEPAEVKSAGSTNSGFRIDGGRCPLLDVPFEEVEPVDYGVAGVALLSGVNSGGKTSTLDLVAFVTVLAHMGLPVPADRARIARVDALHYQAKSQGTLDAGAFESTLREFAALAGSDRRRMVLVDELESITEPGASAVIIAGILEALAESESTAVFVSHLAREIREETTLDLTVDGIEALGLEDGELLVDRSPRKNHLARSTPELIVEKLATEHTDNVDQVDDADSTFYQRLLTKFDN